MSYSQNSLKRGYMGEYGGVYTQTYIYIFMYLGFGVLGLGSKLLQRGLYKELYRGVL